MEVCANFIGILCPQKCITFIQRTYTVITVIKVVNGITFIIDITVFFKCLSVIQVFNGEYNSYTYCITVFRRV